MEEDLQKNSSDEHSSFINRGSYKSGNEIFHEISLGPKPDKNSQIMPKTRKSAISAGTDLDSELVKVRGNNCFLTVVSSLVVSFAFAELIVFSVPFLELIPPLECQNIDEDDWYDCDTEQA